MNPTNTINPALVRDASLDVGQILDEGDDGRVVQASPTLGPQGRKEFLDDGGGRERNLQ